MAVPSLFLSLFLLTFFINPAHSRNRDCPAGQFFSLDARRCQLCPPGTYRSDEFFEPKTRCNPCRAGTFNPNFGVVSEEVCRFCYEDTFSEEGSANCQPCPPGQIANRGARECVRCGPGFAASMETFRGRPRNRSKCIRCPRGTYSKGQNNRICEQCPDYMTSPKQSTSLSDCGLCPPGKQAYAGSAGCVPCTIGLFKPGREGKCENCPRGTISAKEGSASCTPCPKGMRPNGSRRKKCVPCPDGTTTMAPGAPYCRIVGLPCPAGFFETKTGDCNTCPTGYRYNLEEKTCEKCTEGSVSTGRLQRNCRRCPEGQRPNYNQKECICQEGEQFAEDGKCEKCPRGTFINNDSIGEDSCRKCRLGFFANERGSINCNPCPRGTATSKEGSTRCERCGPDLMPSVPLYNAEQEANGCVAKNTGCPLGWERQEVGATDGPIRGCRRISCPLGTPLEDVGKVCLPCEPGKALLNEERTKCRRCPRDEVSDGGIITECRKCPNGLLQDLYDGSKCTCKRFGWGIQDGICKPCSKGNSSLGLSGVCTECKPGSFADRVRQGSCSKCEKGTVSRKSGARRCRKCPEGTISNKLRGGTECVRV